MSNRFVDSKLESYPILQCMPATFLYNTSSQTIAHIRLNDRIKYMDLKLCVHKTEGIVKRKFALTLSINK